MLKTSSSAGQQLVTENDELLVKIEAMKKKEKEIEDELHTLKNTNAMLKVTATRSHEEADNFHQKLVSVQSRMKQLEKDNELLSSMENTGRERRQSNDYKKHSKDEIVASMEHEIQTLKEHLESEQNKCAQFFANAETNL